MRAISRTVTPGTGNSQKFVRLDDFATAVLAGTVVVSGGAQFSLFHSFDDPNDLVNPTPVNSMFWDNSLLPTAAKGGTANVTFQIKTCPLYFVVTLMNGVGSARATFLQVGEHSHSNISSGPFAPPMMADMEDIPAGSNFSAMAK